jgi:hypothetical protein
MNFDQALWRYREGRFTDRDLTDCTGLSVRAWRELITTKAVQTVEQSGGRGRVRVCDQNVFKRTALIAALNRAGLSLAVSGQIAYFLPFHTVLYTVCDPKLVLLGWSTELDQKTGLPPRLKHPKVDWFSPDRPAKADPESDWVIEIYERRFVGVIYNPKERATIFGDLRNGGANFVAWFPFRQRIPLMGTATEVLLQELPRRFVHFVAEWEEPTKWSKELKRYGYTYEKHDRDDDPLCISAEATARSPLVKTTINVTLALRRALRRYIGIEPTELGSKIGKSR